MYKIPKIKKPGLFSFLNPLSNDIWLYLGISIGMVSIIMMALARFSPYEWRSTHPCNSDNEYVENQFTFFNSVWFAIGTVMQQGSDINPKALSTRLIGGVWWFFTLIIISSYTANLAAFLTVEKVDLTITNAEELANQSKVSYGVFKGGSTMNFFKVIFFKIFKDKTNVLISSFFLEQILISKRKIINYVFNFRFFYWTIYPILNGKSKNLIYFFYLRCFNFF